MVSRQTIEFIYFRGQDLEIGPLDVLPFVAVAFPYDIGQFDRIEIIPERFPFSLIQQIFSFTSVEGNPFRSRWVLISLA